MSTHLTLAWTKRRAKASYGDNVVNLTEVRTGSTWRACGGGYDMVGTVFAKWLEAAYQKELRLLAPKSHYGMEHNEDSSVSLDGACGISSMLRIAEAIGLNVERLFNKQGNTSGFIVEHAAVTAAA